MSASELLGIEPLELKFPFELKKQISCSLSFRTSLMTTLPLSIEILLIRVKTTNPKKYCVRPNMGIISPRSTCDVLVMMQAQREAPPDMQCKDKFLVQSVVTTAGTAVKDITPEMFTKESGNKVDEVKLRESEEGLSPRASESEIGNTGPRESSTARREYVDTQERSSEVAALISKLTEERNSAIQQSNKLRQELELVRREVTKQQGGGFSFMFVLLVALLGIILGYLVKPNSCAGLFFSCGILLGYSYKKKRGGGWTKYHNNFLSIVS
uniref:MSP domain-containing protein n=1 Tax=Ananas comosus var. bracteatus TaxID=296719 RepID=A0A6V7PKS7_ANACO|nr:unnamed protein product [Ananas comosus var. bracteatus]